MKKILLIVLTFIATFGLVGCQSSLTDLDYIMEKESFILGFTDFHQWVI